MTVISLEPRHLSDMLSLCRQALPLDTFEASLLERRVWSDPDAPDSYRLGYMLDGNLAGFAVGVRRLSGERSNGGLLLLAVAPAYHRRGVATALLDELEARMRHDGLDSITVGGTTPNFFWPGLDIRYTPAYCLFTARGYAVADMRLNMEVALDRRPWDTSEIDERLEDSGITVRRLVPADRQRYSDWLLASWSRGWHDEGMNAFANDPVSGFVALRDGQPCAFAVYDVEGFAGHFGPTGTDEAMRGRGVATALFYRCMQDMQARGLRTAEVVWVGPIAYYARIADAVAQRTFWALRKFLAITPIHSEHS